MMPAKKTRKPSGREAEPRTRIHFARVNLGIKERDKVRAYLLISRGGPLQVTSSDHRPASLSTTFSGPATVRILLTKMISAWHWRIHSVLKTGSQAIPSLRTETAYVYGCGEGDNYA